MQITDQLSTFEFSELFKKQEVPQWDGSFYWLGLGHWKTPGFELFMKTGTTLRSCHTDRFITYESEFDFMLEVNDNNATRAFTTQELGAMIGLYTAAIPSWNQGLKVWGFRPDSPTAKPLFNVNENTSRCVALKYLLVTGRIKGKLIDEYYRKEFAKANEGKGIVKLMLEHHGI